jgi:hypothetical protein
MNRASIDRPGPLIFIGGVLLVIASTGLGLYLSSLRPVELPHADWHSDYERLEAIRNLAVAHASLSSNVHALMWMVFGLGATLTMVGLRMMTRPNLDFHPSPPIGSIRKVFENPE